LLKFQAENQYKLQRGISLLILLIFCCSYLIQREKIESIEIDRYYLQQLEILNQKLAVLKQSCERGSKIGTLRIQFRDARQVYKKAAIFIDFFNPLEAQSMNGPAVNRVEDDNPDVVIPPHGMQAIEKYLFEKFQSSTYKNVKKEIEYATSIIEQLKNEPDRVNKFKDEYIFQAMRSALLRLTTLGISGYDSPLAKQSIPEAKSTLEGIQNILALYKKDLEHGNEKEIKELNNLLGVAESYLSNNINFNSFDRLAFITRFANPVYTLLDKIKLPSSGRIADGMRPLNPAASTIFESDAFNIAFFSPDKRYKVNAERIELGKQLFYDPVLSATENRSCATCHKPGLAFTDGLKTALSTDQKTFLLRNTPTLLNSVFQTKQFFDSRTNILESQLSDVVHNQEEMKGSLKKSVDDLRNDPHYSNLFRQAYPDDKNPVSEYNIANAVSSYVRSLVAMNSRFDQYMRGDRNKLSKDEKNGFNLFMGKAKCGTCHFIPLFNGLVPPEFTETESEVLGVPKTKNRLHPVLDPDLGKFNFTRAVIHKHAFKIPTLRNVELTAPYMHNGVFSTLEEVMDFYNKAGGSGLHIAPPNQTLPSERLNLSKKEIQEIICFMKTLTDTRVSGE
jgi:cytochrome c peroxidase